MIDATRNQGPDEPHAETLYHRRLPHAERVYFLLASCFVTLIVLTNIIGPKLFVWFGASLTAGLITYPLTFLITDIVSEVWGKRRADRMVVIGFLMSLLMLGIVQLSIYLPTAAVWSRPPEFSDPEGMQSAWVAVFGVGPWLVTGSMFAYLAAQLCDNYLFHFWRRLTHGRHLWLRNNGSTIISQLVDTFIVNSFLFYGAFGWDFMQGIEAMTIIYLFKLGIAWADTPFCYLGVWAARRHLRAMGAFTEAGDAS